MDLATLATDAVSFVTPYLIDFAKEVASDASSEGSKSVWTWIKGKLTTPAGAEAVIDAERDPKDPANAGLAGGRHEGAQGRSGRRQVPRGLAEAARGVPVVAERERRRRPQQGRAGERRKLGEYQLTAIPFARSSTYRHSPDAASDDGEDGRCWRLSRANCRFP